MSCYHKLKSAREGHTEEFVKGEENIKFKAYAQELRLKKAFQNFKQDKPLLYKNVGKKNIIQVKIWRSKTKRKYNVFLNKYRNFVLGNFLFRTIILTTWERAMC